MRARHGMTLVELVVALLVLSIGLVALAGASAVAQRSLNTSATLERVARSAGAVLDSVALEPVPASGSRSQHGVLVSWTVQHDSAGARIDVTAEAGDGAGRIQLSFGGRGAPR